MTDADLTQTNNLDLSNQAMAFLGLTQQPFSAAVLSSNAFYKDATLQQLIETTRHHLQFSDLLLIIEGDIGSGKTTLFRQLLQYESDKLYLFPVPAMSTQTLAQIKDTLSFNLKEHSETESLEDSLKRIQVFDQTPVIIIDDAHVLTDTTLQELLRYQKQLENDNDLKLKIIMLANKGMAKTIETISDRQHNQLYVQTLPDYTASQAHALLQQRLNAVDYQAEDYFNDEQMQLILKKANGTPLQIMQLAIKQLELITKKNTHVSSPALNAKILLPVSALALMAVLIVYFFMYSDEPAQPDTSLQDITHSVATDSAETVPLYVGSHDQPLVNPLADTVADTETENIIDNAMDVETDDTAATAIDDDAVITSVIDDTSNLTTGSIAVEETLSANELISTNETTLQIKKINVEQNTADEAVAEPIIIPQPAAVTKTEITTEIKKQINTPANKPTEDINTVSKSQLELANASFAQLTSMGLHDSSWLMQQDANNWTLQILGAREPATLVKFAQQHKLSEASAWFKTELSGKPWYVLVHRLYTDKDIARASIQRLPDGLKKARPWVKSVGSVQKSIRQ